MTLVTCAGCGGALRNRFARVVDPRTREPFALDECQDCGLGHTQPQPEHLAPYYGDTYHGGRHGVTADWCNLRRLGWVREARGPGAAGRLLDVGCGDGSFLRAARERGWSVLGTEFNPRGARQAGLEVYERLEEVLPRGPFDCITLWHSLEHLKDPLAALRQLTGALAPGGVMVVAVPDADGAQARLFGAAWFHLDVPRHLFHFGRGSLTRMLERAGLQVEHHWHQELEYDVMGAAQSALNVLMPTPNVFFDRLTGKPSEGSITERTLSFALGPALSALALTPVTLTTLLGRGGTLIVSARPAASPSP